MKSNIKQLCKEAGITQAELAEAVGVTADSITNYAQDYTGGKFGGRSVGVMSLRIAVSIAERLGVEVTDLYEIEA